MNWRHLSQDRCFFNPTKDNVVWGAFGLYRAMYLVFFILCLECMIVKTLSYMTKGEFGSTFLRAFCTEVDLNFNLLKSVYCPQQKII